MVSQGRLTARKRQLSRLQACGTAQGSTAQVESRVLAAARPSSEARECPSPLGRLIAFARECVLLTSTRISRAGDYRQTRQRSLCYTGVQCGHNTEYGVVCGTLST